MAEGTGLYPIQTTQFSTNLELLLQQKGSRLRGKVKEGTHVGKMASPVNQIQPIATSQPAGRFAPIGRTDSDFVRPWVFPQFADCNQLIDGFDELQTIVDVKSAYAENAANAFGRKIDDVILTAATATRSLGVDAGGLSTEAFDTTKFQIAATYGASAASGLTVAKLIECKRIFERYENDLSMERPTLVIGSQQHSDLLNQVQVVSTEFRSTPTYDGDGNVTSFLGFNIVRSERLPQTTANVTRGVLAFVPSGIHLGIWQDVTSRVSIREDLSSQPFQLYSKMSVGAVRLQPGKVIQILCADTTGAAITP